MFKQWVAVVKRAAGPSFDQFTSAEAIAEIKNLFKWAKSSRRGLILFIDEVRCGWPCYSHSAQG